MKIVVGADHRGFQLKQLIVKWLRGEGHEMVDVGTSNVESVDYTDFALDAAEKVAHGEAQRGILICGSGAGMSIAANKVQGVRAALAVNDEGARLARAHNDANVLALGAKFVDSQGMAAIVQTFLAARCTEERHARRVEKIKAIEESYLK